jgi:hypothetical protein
LAPRWLIADLPKLGETRANGAFFGRKIAVGHLPTYTIMSGFSEFAT